MENFRYETHNMPNPALPFIFHPWFHRTQPVSAANWHENIELLECLEGSGYFRLGPQTVYVKPGDLVVVNGNTLHSYGTESRFVYRCLIIDNSFFLSNGIPIHSVYFEPTPKDIRLHPLLDRIAQSYEDLVPTDYRSVLAVRARVLELVELLCREHTVERPATLANDHVNKAMTYLRSHLQSPFCLEELSSFVGISKYHLLRQFKLYTGSTPVQTLNLMRCTEARRLILEGMPISAAAQTCGFENLSWFTRTFRKHFQCLPSDVKP